MDKPNLVTSMFPKLQKMDFFIRKQELPTMQAQKCGKISPTMPNLISGHWGVLSTK